MSVQLDHLVVAAATLAQGVAWCEATLGVTPGPGGRHDFMGTHNRLLKIATDTHPGAYLEIIAIDPEAPPPRRARWFGLDDPVLRARLRSGPCLIHFVARSTRLAAQRQALVDTGHDPGTPVAASRATPHGVLSWDILVRDDGALVCGGTLPTLIQWHSAHPTDFMPESGVTLRALSLRGLPEPARAVLDSRSVHFEASPGPALSATLTTPLGEVVLSSPYPEAP